MSRQVPRTRFALFCGTTTYRLPCQSQVNEVLSIFRRFMGTQPASNPGDNVMGASLRWVAPSALKWCQRVTCHRSTTQRQSEAITLKHFWKHWSLMQRLPQYTCKSVLYLSCPTQHSPCDSRNYVLCGHDAPKTSGRPECSSWVVVSTTES